jgi:hypothetical protein
MRALMERIDSLFDSMDNWRHLPAYQLERRADLFFSLYIPEVLKAKLGFPVRRALIPEFPVRKGTIYPNTPREQKNRSFKIDYVAFSEEDGSKAVLVELKTEMRSRCKRQDKYLEASQKTGIPELLAGILDIFRASKAKDKQKYFNLLLLLEELGQLNIPEAMKDIFDKKTRLNGVKKLSWEIKIPSSAIESQIVYIQPDGVGDNIITFADFQAIVEKHDDPISQRFAHSLAQWAHNPAGSNI